MLLRLIVERAAACYALDLKSGILNFTELNDAFDIEIKPNNLVPDNFNSAKAMLALIEELQDE